MNRNTIGILASTLLLAAATDARAADAPPAGTVKANTATTGSTEIAKGDAFATGQLPKDEDASHVTEASIAAGGLFSSGNARALALTAGGKLRLRRDEHQFSAAVASNFARSGKAGENVATTVENYQGLLRYDYFLTNNFALFLQSSGRHDRFQGLDLRWNVDPGIAYYAVNTKKQTLRLELGYDFQYDIRRDEARVQPVTDPEAPALPLLPKTKALHNVRAFAGYENKLYKEVSFITSLEYLQNVEDAGTYRFVFDAGIKSNISDNFALATTYTMRFENRPLPDVEKADSIASVNLVYTLF